MQPPYEASPLRRINPLVKLAVAILYIVVVTLVFDPLVQLAFLMAAIGLLLLFEHIHPVSLLKVMLPFALVGFGYLWVNLFFHESIDEYTRSLALTSVVADPATNAGITLFLRALAVGAVSYLFIRTTDPAELMRSLMQQARLPPYLGFSIFSAVQFLPDLQGEFRQIRLARAMRNADAGRLGASGYAAAAMPLLASTIRKAGRAAISMEARGLTRPMRRTSLRAARFARRDAIFALLAIALLAALLAGAATLGSWSR